MARAGNHRADSEKNWTVGTLNLLGGLTWRVAGVGEVGSTVSRMLQGPIMGVRLY